LKLEVTASEWRNTHYNRYMSKKKAAWFLWPQLTIGAIALACLLLLHFSPSTYNPPPDTKQIQEIHATIGGQLVLTYEDESILTVPRPEPSRTRVLATIIPGSILITTFLASTLVYHFKARSYVQSLEARLCQQVTFPDSTSEIGSA